eukprot:283696-Pelagomonas_calceolata.AAC.1
MDVDSDDEALRAQDLSDDDPDWDPFEKKSKGKRKGRGSRGRSVASSDDEDLDSVMSEGGYSTGYSTVNSTKRCADNSHGGSELSASRTSNWKLPS